MPRKPDITNASGALWSAAVERERVIAALWLRLKSADNAAHAFKRRPFVSQAILAIIACLLLPKYFAAMASTSSHLGRPHARSRLLRILGADQADALLARAQR